MGAHRAVPELAEKIGSLQSWPAAAGSITEVRGRGTPGEFEPDKLVHLTRALMKGLLSPILTESVNYVNAPALAASRGIRITESRAPARRVRHSCLPATGRRSGEKRVDLRHGFGRSDARIVEIDGYNVDFKPEGF
jgi:D-3-phosphoglycerate dehydrogenase